MSYSRRQSRSYEGRRGHGKGFKRRPVELGEELEVDIAESSPKEEGIARVQGLVIRIPNTKPGDPREDKDYPGWGQGSRCRNNQVEYMLEGKHVV